MQAYAYRVFTQSNKPNLSYERIFGETAASGVEIFVCVSDDANKKHNLGLTRHLSVDEKDGQRKSQRSSPKNKPDNKDR